MWIPYLFWKAIYFIYFEENGSFVGTKNIYHSNIFKITSLNSTLEWYFKQQDHSVGLSFKSNFHFALVGHLIKGFRHPSSATVSRTTRVLSLLLDIVGKSQGKDKYEVTKNNVAYLGTYVQAGTKV